MGKFKMKGFSWPVDRSVKVDKELDGKSKLKDGRAGSSAFQYNSPIKQTNSDLKEYLLSEKGFNQSEADRMIVDGAYTLESQDFMKWYIAKKGGDVPAPDANIPTKLSRHVVPF